MTALFCCGGFVGLVFWVRFSGFGLRCQVCWVWIVELCFLIEACFLGFVGSDLLGLGQVAWLEY